MTAAVTAVAAPLVLRINGGYYSDSPSTLILLAMASIPCVINNILSSAAVSFGSIRLWLVSDLVLGVGLVALAFMLVPPLGADGLALADLGGYVATDLVLLPVLRKRRA